MAKAKFLSDKDSEGDDEKKAVLEGRRTRRSGARGAEPTSLTLPDSRLPATSTPVEDVDTFYNARTVIDTARRVTGSTYIR